MLTKELPMELEPCLARISLVADTGVSRWHEVVYYDPQAEKWASYGQSSTFSDGEQVESWRLIDESAPGVSLKD